MTVRLCLGVSALLLLVSCNTKSKEAIELKFNMHKGSRFEYNITMDMNMQQIAMRQDSGVKNTMGFTYLFEVVEENDTAKTVASTINKINMAMDAMGNQMHFDTDSVHGQDTSTPNAMLGNIFSTLKGAKFTFRINNKGEISDIQGLNDMRQKMASVPGAPPIEAMSGLFNEESFRQNIEQAFAAYPGKPVKTGESWTKNVSATSQGMKVNSINTYTLQSVQGDDALIKVASKLSSAGSEQMQGMQMNMTGTSAGTMHYDIPTGMPTDANVDMKMDIKMKGQGLDMPMTMTSKMTIKGKKL